MEQSFLTANIRSADQEILSVLLNPKLFTMFTENCHCSVSRFYVNPLRTLTPHITAI
jgi:hypothetical protein